EAFDLLKDRQVFNAAIKEFQGQRRHSSSHTTRRSKEEDALRLRFQELQRRNAVLMGEERKLRERVHHLEQVNAILRQAVQQYEDPPTKQRATHSTTPRRGRLQRSMAHSRRGGVGTPDLTRLARPPLRNTAGCIVGRR